MRGLLCLLVLGLTGCPAPDEAPSKSSPAPDKIDWAKTVQIEVRLDDTKPAVVADLSVAPGFHAYTIGETTGRPLKLTVDAPWSVDGEVQYPKGIEKNLEIGRSVIVEGQAQVVAPLAAEGSPKQVTGTLHYQICNDDLCDRPRKKTFDLSRP